MPLGWREAQPADFAVIGDPVAHSRSPGMHAAAYRSLGLSLRYEAIHVPPGEVAPALDRLRDLGYRGINVTVPHKEEVLMWCRQIEPFAARVRAANTVRLSDRACINTDAPGFLETLLELGLPHRMRVLMLGAGGSARALALALSEAGHELRIFNRTRSRAEQMVADLAINAEVLDAADPTAVDLILNTTSASLQSSDLPVLWNLTKPGAVAYDLVYGHSPFLDEAMNRGLRVVDGLPLLVAQGALSFEWWLGRPAPRQAMMEALRAES